MTSPAPRSPHGPGATAHGDADPARRAPGARRPRRPLPATAFITHALLVGVAITGGMLYLLYTTWVWMRDAPPGSDRGIGGAVGLFICCVGLLFGLTVLVGGIGSLVKADFGPFLVSFGCSPLFVLSLLAVGRGLLMWEPSSHDWRLQMGGFATAAVVLGMGSVLYRARSTREYFGM
ncbi:hypothetical protein [Streptomyces sp. enrichment culture]|uniref:hypothetical protein n=1 Tax=Streptomyces sp. enrichment culture TaxID=1795815 RepID=UPI003F5464D6